MATEVTKLITVSLGKMQQSRQTKTGPNLRRSLLVASVLHKARDVYITENKIRKSERSHRLPTETSSSPEPVVKRRFTSQSSVDETQSVIEEVSSSTTCTTEPSNENNVQNDSIPVKHHDNVLVRTKVSDKSSFHYRMELEQSSSASSISDSVLDDLASAADKAAEVEKHSSRDEVDKENAPPSVVDTTRRQSCNRCHKRRFSTESHEDASTSLTQTNDEVIKTKRFKATDHLPLLSSTVICDSSSKQQINNLVRIFSQSIPDLNSSPNEDSISSTKDRPSELLTFAVHLRESIALTA